MTGAGGTRAGQPRRTHSKIIRATNAVRIVIGVVHPNLQGHRHGERKHSAPGMPLARVDEQAPRPPPPRAAGGRPAGGGRPGPPPPPPPHPPPPRPFRVQRARSIAEEFAAGHHRSTPATVPCGGGCL